MQFSVHCWVVQAKNITSVALLSVFHHSIFQLKPCKSLCLTHGMEKSWERTVCLGWLPRWEMRTPSTYTLHKKRLASVTRLWLLRLDWSVILLLQWWDKSFCSYEQQKNSTTLSGFPHTVFFQSTKIRVCEKWVVLHCCIEYFSHFYLAYVQK